MDRKNLKIHNQEKMQELIKGIRLAQCMNIMGETNEENIEDTTLEVDLFKELTISETLTCSYCNITFVDMNDQRSHYKLDWHRYNLKKALRGLKPIPEDKFLELADEVSSISGSDTDTTTDDSESENSSMQVAKNNDITTKRHAQVFFENDSSKLISLYRCLVQGKRDSSDNLVKSFLNLTEGEQMWMIVMLGGGHFAAAIFKGTEAILHKTFHCYTVRAKQGGAQSAKDSKGNHAKSAGASLRRYNEQALLQHVQEIMTTWAKEIGNCKLILYRGAGPYNRNVLFGGKSPPLDKNDPRLRSIPFPTRRATFNEVQRVHDMLSTVHVYDSSLHFIDRFPPPDRTSPGREKKSLMLENSGSGNVKTSPKKIDRCKERKSPEREIPGEDIKSITRSSESTGESLLDENDVEINFEELQEFADTVPQWVKDCKKQGKKKRKKLTAKQKLKLEKKQFLEELELLQKRFVTACKINDKQLLVETLKMIGNLEDRKIENNSLENASSEVASNELENIECSNLETHSSKTADHSIKNTNTSKLTKEDFLECLNSIINDDTGDTLLHLASIKNLPDFVILLLEAGANPSVKNTHQLTPYNVAGDKKTRNAFRRFAALFPDKYDYKLAQIPDPLTDDREKELEEKKKERKKLKREKEKEKKKMAFERKCEEDDKLRFLGLSDREKRALAAEKRIVQSTTSNMKSVRAPVLSRCFQCGTDITGKVPFEYDIHRFCSVPCLKAHRAKTNSYGKEI